VRILKYLLLLIVVAGGVSFAWLNAQPVSFNYYAGTAQIRLSLVLVLFLIGGWLLGIFSMLRSYLSLRRRLARVQRKLTVAEKEIGNLRSLPIKHGH